METAQKIANKKLQHAQDCTILVLYTKLICVTKKSLDLTNFTE